MYPEVRRKTAFEGSLVVRLWLELKEWGQKMARVKVKARDDHQVPWKPVQGIWRSTLS